MNTDTPIKTKKEDILGRAFFAEKLGQSVLDWKEKESAVIGLFGPWGCGKTSIINLIIEYIESKTKSSSNNEKPIILKFNPWYFSGQDQLISIFFRELATALDPGDSLEGTKSIGKKLIMYSKFFDPLAFIPGAEPWASIIKKLLGSTGEALAGLSENKDTSLEKLKKEIEASILENERKILIIIDDVDRLTPKEVRQIFQLIKVSADFPKIIYLVAFDPEEIEKVLTESGLSGDVYLQKIIQHQSIIPAIDQTDIDKYLYFSNHPIPQNHFRELRDLSHGDRISLEGAIASSERARCKLDSVDSDDQIEIHLPDEINIEDLGIGKGDSVFIEGIVRKNNGDIFVDIADGGEVKSFYLSQIDSVFVRLNIDRKRISKFDVDFTHVYTTYIRKLFTTLRQAKRFIPSLIFDLPQITDEVDLHDFVILEVIKLISPRLYNDIAKNWWVYVDQFSNDINSTSPLRGFDDKKTEEKQKIIQEHINAVLESVNLPKEDKETLIEILCLLFPNVSKSHDKYHHWGRNGDDRAEKRLCSTSFFKYFTYKIAAPKDFPDSLLETIINNWNESESDELEGLIESDFLDFKKSKKVIPFIDNLFIFLGNIENDVAKILIEFLYQNHHIFSDKKSGMFFSERDKSLGLMFRLINDKIDGGEIQKVLEKIVNDVTSIWMATEVAFLSSERNRGDFYNIYENTDSSKIKRLLVSKLKAHYIDKNKDIFEKQRWPFILSQCSLIDEASKKMVNDYIFSLIEKNPCYIGRILNVYVTIWDKPSDATQTRFKDLERDYDMEKLFNATKKYGDDAWSNKDEKRAIELFLSHVEDSKKKTKL